MQLESHQPSYFGFDFILREVICRAFSIQLTVQSEVRNLCVNVFHKMKQNLLHYCSRV